MNQVALNFDFASRPTPAELGLSYGTQAYRLYDKLLSGPITNAQIVRELDIMNSTGRISDLRTLLRPFLMDIAVRRVKAGLWEYKLSGG